MNQNPILFTYLFLCCAIFGGGKNSFRALNIQKILKSWYRSIFSLQVEFSGCMEVFYLIIGSLEGKHHCLSFEWPSIVGQQEKKKELLNGKLINYFFKKKKEGERWGKLPESRYRETKKIFLMRKLEVQPRRSHSNIITGVLLQENNREEIMRK